VTLAVLGLSAGWPLELLLIIASVGALLLLLYLLRHRLLAILVRRLLRQQRNAQTLEPRTLSISPEALAATEGELPGVVPWSGVDRIVVTDEYAFFYLHPMIAHVLPMRAFANEGDFADFIATAQCYWEEAHQPQP
jgi:hypothetical protein